MSDELIVNDKQAMSALKQHGGNIVTAILVVLLAFFGWQFYQKNYAKVDTAAADLYTNITSQQEEINLAAQNPDATKQVNDARTALYKDIDTLTATHGNTIYAWQALMIKSRQKADEGDFDAALQSLEQAAKIPLDDKGLIAITRLQQAQILLGKNDNDKALTVINSEFPKSFEPSRQEILGDIYAQKNDIENAKTAYQKAREILTERGENRALLNLKMQALGMNATAIPSKYQVITIQSNQAQTDETQKSVELNSVLPADDKSAETAEKNKS